MTDDVRLLLAALMDVCATQRRVVAALRWAADPTQPRPFKGIVNHCDAAIEMIAEVEGRIAEAVAVTSIEKPATGRDEGETKDGT